ncbi:MAG TPA: ABC transporter ATP-binding protein [Nitrospiraceae bacterium]|jgi:tungstate transport system ATP-binding protein|nr:ABC transporter ATP-binding protein [Nitrospiraceae bacterium]
MSLTFGAYDISKSYSENPVLKDCSCAFDKSGVYVLMGPNGCGKSTFLRLCALIENPDRGEITFFSRGHALEKDIELRRRITLVLPKVGVFNSTVFQNVSYGLRIRGVKRGEAEKKVLKALEFVGLIDRRGQYALTLSSGETQRLGIARAMVIEPEILFLDEPTASVDQRNTKIIEDIVLRMKKDGTSTVVITTHDKEQAERLGDWLMEMSGGNISAGKNG